MLCHSELTEESAFLAAPQIHVAQPILAVRTHHAGSKKPHRQDCLCQKSAVI